MNSNNIDLENMTYRPACIGGLQCNINREESSLLKLFDDIVPNYDNDKN